MWTYSKKNTSIDPNPIQVQGFQKKTHQAAARLLQ